MFSSVFSLFDVFPDFLYFIQERIRIGKELLEAKRIEEDNERKRYGFSGISTISCFAF